LSTTEQPAAPPIEIPTSDGGTLLVPRQRVWIGNVSNGNHSTHFTRSLAGLVEFDRSRGLGLWGGALYQESGANISKGRNELVTKALAIPELEWLLLLDSDMVFPPETILQLLASAQVTGSKIVGGLCVFVGGLGPIPTLYQHRSADAITGVQFDYPDGAQLQVAATGAACLMVHREVFEAYQAKMRDDQDWLLRLREAEDPTLMQLIDRDMLREPSVDFGWFQERVRIKRHEDVDGQPVSEHWMGEDIDFCLRMGELGYPIFVDCTLEIGHCKHGRIWYPRDIRDGVGVPRPPIVAVIPVKDRLDLTSDLVHQLREQGDTTEIVICDNGSGSKTKNWLASQDDLTVLDMPDAGINEMWNAGVDYALGRHGPRVHVAILNNDLRLGPAFLRTLSQALTDDRALTAVCGNYDGRTAPTPVVETRDICAGRYDGTGGFAGFAFMVRGEWFSTGYRFPEECRLWFGDNDLIMSILRADTHRGYDDRPSKAGIVLAAQVEHLDGGSQTAGDVAWSKHRAQTEADRAAFEAKWTKIMEADAAAERVKAGDFGPLYEHLCEQPSDIREHLPTLHDLAVKLDAETVIELGVRTGVSTVAWLAALQQTGGTLWAVDATSGPPMITAHQQCRFIQGDDLSDEVLDQLPKQADIVFIDTVHTYDHTTDELLTYWMRVRPGGCIVLHDTAVETFDHHLGDLAGQPPYPVRTAVEDFLAHHEGLEVEWHENCNGLAVIRVPE